ncbi:MAG: hypothetical protein VYA45_01145, partial [Candidatus Thermoplasmatota archaeon]|nr:hypothetical protein [Candidatus Thermoplasmatota archaeon]
DGTSSTDTLSAESVRAMNAALAPIVDGCTAMMGSMMMSSGMAGGPHHGVDMHHDWRDCEEEYWDEEYENEPRTRDSAETDRRNLDRDRCEGHEWDEEWDEHDLEEENENFFWEENWDEEARIYTEHWANSDGEFWLTENYANCWGALEWQDPEGNEIVEEWELDDCGDSEESDGDDWVDDDESEEETETHPCNSPDAENCED